jgi:hypothetical protein
MVKAGQADGTEVGQTETESHPALAIQPVTRQADEVVVLVSERSAVWDRRAVPLPSPEALQAFDVGALGPMPAEWTADLVHCRLLSVDALARRLPRVKVPAQYRSFLGDLQPQDAAPGRMKPLSSEEEQRLDWTLGRLCAWGSIDKAVLMGVMAGRSLQTISKVTFGIAAREGGKGLHKTSVHRRYMRNTGILADAWNMLRLPIDEGTRDCWQNVASQKFRRQ